MMSGSDSVSSYLDFFRKVFENINIVIVVKMRSARTCGHVIVWRDGRADRCILLI